MTQTVTISKQEYEQLKLLATKLQKIDKTIHEDLSSEEILQVASRSGSFDFLKNPKEEIYTKDDVKKGWNEEISS